jgi:hypothetical protein
MRHFVFLIVALPMVTAVGAARRPILVRRRITAGRCAASISVAAMALLAACGGNSVSAPQQEGSQGGGGQDATVLPPASDAAAEAQTETGTVVDGAIPDVSVDGASGAVGVPGSACDRPGRLGCAGTHQKLTLLCGDDKRWATNQTCGANQFCESGAGPNTGLCLSEAAACAGQAGGAAVCADKEVVQCSADNTSTSVVADCIGACEAGTCVDVADPCPGVLEANCASDCGLPMTVGCDNCSVAVGSTFGGVLRLPPPAEACTAGCSPERRILHARLVDVTTATRVRTFAPWRVAYVAPGLPVGVCIAQGSECLVLPTNPPAGSEVLLFSTTDYAFPRNVLFEKTAQPCP